MSERRRWRNARRAALAVLATLVARLPVLAASDGSAHDLASIPDHRKDIAAGVNPVTLNSDTFQASIFDPSENAVPVVPGRQAGFNPGAGVPSLTYVRSSAVGAQTSPTTVNHALALAVVGQGVPDPAFNSMPEGAPTPPPCPGSGLQASGNLGLGGVGTSGGMLGDGPEEAIRRVEVA